VDLKESVRETMTAEHISLGGLAKMTGVGSGSSWSQWMSGKYPGDFRKFDKAAKQFLSFMNKRSKLQQEEINFVDTSVSVKLSGALLDAHILGEIIVCCGPSGIGKTRALLEYIKQNTGVILVEAHRGYSAKTFFTQLIEMLEIECSHSINDMLKNSVEKLKGSRRLLIIDECEYLNLKTIDLIRRLNDFAGIGIVLVGTNQLYDNLMHKGFEQINNRASKIMLDVITEEDAEKIINSVLPGNKVCREIWEYASQNTRILCKILKRIIQISCFDKNAITSLMVKQAAEMVIR